MRYVATIGDREYTIEIIDEHHVEVDGVKYEVDFESVTGKGIRVSVDGRKLLVGNRRLLDDAGIRLPGDFLAAQRNHRVRPIVIERERFADRISGKRRLLKPRPALGEFGTLLGQEIAFFTTGNNQNERKNRSYNPYIHLINRLVRNSLMR